MADMPPAVPFLAPGPRGEGRPAERPTPPRPRSGDLTIERTAIDGAVVLALHGDLTAAAAPTVLVAVQQEFATHALPVVCDLTFLGSVAASATGVFAAAVAGCGGWPVVELALAAPSRGVARQLRMSGARRYLVVRSTVALAVRDAPAGPPVLRDRVELDRPTALLEGRRFVVDCCLRWRAAEHAAAAEAALPLLQAAVQRCPGPFGLQVTYDRKNVVLRALLPQAGTGDLPAGLRVSPGEAGGEVLSTAVA